MYMYDYYHLQYIHVHHNVHVHVHVTDMIHVVDQVWHYCGTSLLWTPLGQISVLITKVSLFHRYTKDTFGL